MATIMDLFDPGLDYQARYPVIDALREEGDGIHAGPFPDSWFLTRYDDISRVQRDAPTFLSADVDFVGHFSNVLTVSRDDPALAVVHAFQNSLLFKDPPEHRRLRKLVSAAFTPTAIAAMRETTEKIAGQLLDRIGGDETNLVSSYAVPLPVYVIATMLGFEADNSQLLAWSHAVDSLGEQAVGIPGDAKRTIELGAALMDHIDEISEQRRLHPRNDLISGLCAAEDEGDKLNRDELAGMVLLLLSAGNLTTTTLINNTVEQLLDHPDALGRVLDDKDLVPAAAEEALRLEPSIQMSIRVCATDVVFGERRFSTGSQLFTITAAGNRDPRKFANPNTFDLDRNDRSHLSFAYGIHTCLGAALARMEAGVAIRALLQRFPNLSSGTALRQRRGGIAGGGFDQLPVVLR